MMSLVTGKLYDHRERNAKLTELQAGFTKGRRVEDNVFILDYCIRDSRRRRKELIIAAVSFE